MLKPIFLMSALMAVCLPSFAEPVQAPDIKHVIYITLDGTRWQDVMKKAQFPKLWQHHAAYLKIYGEPGGKDKIEVAPIPISLPSYQSQMTGAIQPCQNNECGQVQVETMPEYLLTHLKLAKKEVAVFSSWPVIGDALESKRGSVYSNVGNIPVVDPETGKPDDFMKTTNFLQTLQTHDHGNRMDEYTFAQSLHYFKKYQPAFLWISLVNADNEAHWNQHKGYRRVLTNYDNYLDELFVTLRQMKLDKNTMVVITTDHGRGKGKNWTSHGPEFPESKATWAFVMNGRLESVRDQNGAAHYSTLSIRPTIEHALQH